MDNHLIRVEDRNPMECLICEKTSIKSKKAGKAVQIAGFTNLFMDLD